jgi:hypothetical protein
MQSPAISRRMPGVGYLFRRDILERHSQLLVRVLCVELCDVNIERKPVGDFAGKPFGSGGDACHTAQDDDGD